MAPAWPCAALSRPALPQLHSAARPGRLAGPEAHLTVACSKGRQQILRLHAALLLPELPLQPVLPVLRLQERGVHGCNGMLKALIGLHKLCHLDVQLAIFVC